MLSLLKNMKSASMKGSVSPRHIVRRYNQTEAKEYAQNVKAGLILGVDPAVVDDCQICQQLLTEMMNGNGQLLQAHVDSRHEDSSKETLLTFWTLKHNGPGHLKAHSIEC